MKPWWSTTLALFLLAFTCSSSMVECCLHQASMLVFFSLSTPVLRLWMMRAAHTSPSINHTSKNPRIQLFLTLQLTGTHCLLCHETQSQFRHDPQDPPAASIRLLPTVFIGIRRRAKQVDAVQQQQLMHVLAHCNCQQSLCMMDLQGH
jgi:hypothetical protein